MLSAKIEEDLKAAMLAGNKGQVSLLRTIKSALQYEAVRLGAKERGLSDEEIQKVLFTEAKKRREAADLYVKAGEQSRAQAEEREAEAIGAYLPEALSDGEIAALVDGVIAKMGEVTLQDMGRIIEQVRALNNAADSSAVARIVKIKLQA